MQDTTEITKTGIVPFFTLETDDRLGLVLAVPGRAYNDQPDRNLWIKVTGSSIDRFQGKIIRDSYNDLPVEHENFAWALPTDAEITGIGSYHPATDKDYAGELRRGLSFWYKWRSKTGTTHTCPIQEVILCRNGLAVNLFNTDLNKVANPPKV